MKDNNTNNVENAKSVGIVVVTYNRLSLLKEVIAALRIQSFTDYQIIVVNNGSTDQTQEWLEGQKDIILITQPNLGGAGGFFTGMKYVAEHGFDYCWVMDDDVVCHHDALAELYHAYTRKSGIGFVCSKVIGIDGCPMNTPVVDERPTKNGYASYIDLISDSMIKVKTATFVSVFCGVSIIRRVGLPYKEFFIWGDDTEYTMRIAQQYECYMACKSIVVHKRTIQAALSFEMETNPSRLRMYFYNFRNNAFVLFKYNAVYKSRFRKSLFFLKKTIDCLVLLLKAQYFKAGVVWRSTISLFAFNPRIEYPNNEK